MSFSQNKSLLLLFFICPKAVYVVEKKSMVQNLENYSDECKLQPWAQVSRYYENEQGIRIYAEQNRFKALLDLGKI